MKDKLGNASWWATLPGILTAVGGIIVALTGLLTGLHAVGLIGPSATSTPASPPAMDTKSVTGTLGTTSLPTNPPSPPEVTRDFLVGRWQVEQTVGLVSGGSVVSVSGGTEVIYQSDGKFIGSQFINETGQKRLLAGRWDFAKLSKDTFRLKVQFDDQTIWLGVFQVVDQDRIHNIEQNYDALRIK